jgi:ArsR family metal-binding transcriptional regulator
MENLFKSKLEAVERLKSFTREITELSLRTDYENVNSMVEKRKEYIIAVSEIDEKIKMNNLKDTDEVKNIKKLINQSVQETIEMDKQIRKNLSDEIKIVKSRLNEPVSSSGQLNIKA